MKSIGVFGVGGLGLSCIMIAKASQYKQIIAVDVSPRALQKAKELGATHVINANDKSDQYVRDEIHAMTSGVNCDLTIDAGGFKST